MAHLIHAVRHALACGAVLAIVTATLAADPPNPFAAAGNGANGNAKGKGGANAKAPDAKTVEMYKAPLLAWFKKYAIKDESANKLYMGYVQAAKAFGYPKPYDPDAAAKKDDAKKDDAKKDDAKKEDAKTEETAKADAKKTDAKKDDAKPKPTRKDVQFIDALDTDNDLKVDEDEFNKWADAFATKEAQDHEAELAALRNKAGKGPTKQQQAQLAREEQQLIRQQEQRARQIEQQLQRAIEQQRRAAQQLARKK